MRRVTVKCAAWLLPLVATLVGCAPDREAELLGEWHASSTYGTIMAAKLKAENPDVSTSEASAVGRRIASTSLQVNADKSFNMAWGGALMKGDWTFNKESGELLLNIKEMQAPPAEGEPLGEPVAQTATWTGYLDDNNNNLRVYPIGPTEVAALKKSGNAKGVGIPLSKNAD